MEATELLHTIGLLWIVISAILVLMMQAGFACLESGLARTKNSINVAIKNVVDFCLSCVIFWVVGYGLMFGTSKGGLFGLDTFVLQSVDPDLNVSFFFQVMFCGTAVTIVSGAVAERVRFRSYLIMAFFIAVLIYPVFGHWVWATNADGTPAGWLGVRGFHDFAGSSVVHGIGGWFALAAVLAIGPRMGRFAGKPIRSSSLPVALLGVLILWFGWFGFNGGSAGGFNDEVPIILVVTLLGCAAGGVAGLGISWIVQRRPDIEATLLGVIAGLVSITAGCNVFNSSDAILVGAIGAVVAYASWRAMNYLKIDDMVGAVPAHAVAGT